MACQMFQLDFLSEAEMMKRFEHNNIIKFIGICTRGEPILAVMEFMLYGMVVAYKLLTCIDISYILDN